MKIVTIVENDPITGVKYGTIDMHSNTIFNTEQTKAAIEKVRAIRTAKLRRENTKHK